MSLQYQWNYLDISMAICNNKTMQIEKNLMDQILELKKKFSYVRLGRILDVDPVTIRRWVMGQNGINLQYETHVRLKLKDYKGEL